MHSEEGKWTYSLYDEIFNNGEYFNTKEEAIEAGKIEYTWEGNCSTFYVGQVKSVDFALGVDVDAILENIGQSVYDEVGEVAAAYLADAKKEHLKELEDELNSVVQKWMGKYAYKPTFFQVIHIEKVSPCLK